MLEKYVLNTRALPCAFEHHVTHAEEYRFFLRELLAASLLDSEAPLFFSYLLMPEEEGSFMSQSKSA